MKSLVFLRMTILIWNSIIVIHFDNYLVIVRKRYDIKNDDIGIVYILLVMGEEISCK